MARKKAVKAEPAGLEQFFPGMGSDDPADVPAGDKKPDDEANKALLARLEGLEKRLSAADERNERLQALSMSLMAGGKKDDAPQNVIPRVSLDLSDLPDPVTDRDGFQKKLAAKVEAAVQVGNMQTADAIGRAAQAGASRTSRLDDLWAKFQADNDDLVPYNDVVEAQVRQLTAQAAARGVDAETYIMSDPVGFSQRVSDATRTRLSQMGVKLGEDGADDDADLDDSGRTASLRGGDGVVTSAGKKTEPHTDFISEIKAMQKAGGYI